MCLPSLVGNWKSPFLARGMTGLLFVCLLFLFLLSPFENTAFPFLRPRSNLFVPQTPVEKGNHSGQLTFPSATPPQQRNLVLNLAPTSSAGIPEACEVQEWTPVSVTAPRTEPVTLTKSYVCVCVMGVCLYKCLSVFSRKGHELQFPPTLEVSKKL